MGEKLGSSVRSKGVQRGGQEEVPAYQAAGVVLDESEERIVADVRFGQILQKTNRSRLQQMNSFTSKMDF